MATYKWVGTDYNIIMYSHSQYTITTKISRDCLQGQSPIDKPNVWSYLY